MWIKTSDGNTIMNSDNISCFFLAQNKENIIIYARTNDDELLLLSRFALDDVDGARKEFELIQSQLERDNQRRWRY